MNPIDRSPYKDDDIAVIGIGLQIAGTDNLEEFWGIFENNIDCIRDLPQCRQDDMEDLAQLYSLMMPNPNGRIPIIKPDIWIGSTNSITSFSKSHRLRRR